MAESSKDVKKDIKVVIVGDGSVGKTCLVKRYVNNSYVESEASGVFDVYDFKQMYKG